ncbi:MAG: hydantoinase/oxoprolinase family protein [Chloroflexi bacterium]|nr:hydantoinase/oxoprolinase family protein [Chloroflexota bacterium]
MTQEPDGLRVGVDIGGTFTDLVAVEAGGDVRLHKLSTTPADFARAVLDGVAALDVTGARRLDEVIHGTTVATNAILERKGARIGLITTRGFRDVLEIRRLRMPDTYNLLWEKPKPLVDRYLRLEVDERISARGEIVRPLDVETARVAIRRLVGHGVESIAVCLLNAYANSAHERRIGELLRALAPDCAVSLSSEVLPEVREYERTSTTVINAYLMPVVGQYLRRLDDRLRSFGLGGPLLIMQSNGGVMPVAAAMARPIHIVESGPAAGVIAGLHLANRLGIPNAITFDMGGTTAKASIVENGRLSQTAEYEVGGGVSETSRLIRGGGYALRTPVVDIAEVGAGGGSLVGVDAGGALAVGPASAGAVPGPVAYGLGGTQPTVTDANLLLGYLNPVALVGGALQLDRAKAAASFAASVAAPLGLDLLRAAHGVHLVANARMIRAVRAVSVERGRDPRDYVLIAFGGSGPVHAAEMARMLDIRRVVVPPAPGLFSAFGLLEARVEHHFVRSFFAETGTLDLAALNAVRAGLEAEARALLAGEGYPGERAALQWSADLRYTGQSFELTVPLPAGELARSQVAASVDAFGAEHERTYGHRTDGVAVDLVNLRLLARGIADERPSGYRAPTRPAARHAATRPAYFGPDVGLRDTPVVGRSDLTAEPRPGPLIVEEYDATTVVPPGCAAWRDAWNNIVVEIGGAR